MRLIIGVLGIAFGFQAAVAFVPTLPRGGGRSSFALPLVPTSTSIIPNGGRLIIQGGDGMRTRRNAGILSMLKEPQGSDAFARFLEKESSLSALNKLSSGPAKLVKFTTVPLAAAAGFLATPKNGGTPLRVFGGVVGGFALKKANDKLRDVSR